MKLRTLPAAALLAMTACVAVAAPATNTLRVEHAWIRWLPATLPAAAYAVIENDSSAPARLTGASSPDYGMVMLHRSQLENGSSAMTMVSGMDIPAHGKAALSPGGYHLMLSDPARPIKPGDTVHMTLHFAGGESIRADFPVRPANTSSP